MYDLLKGVRVLHLTSCKFANEMSLKWLKSELSNRPSRPCNLAAMTLLKNPLRRNAWPA